MAADEVVACWYPLGGCGGRGAEVLLAVSLVAAEADDAMDDFDPDSMARGVGQQRAATGSGGGRA